ncbi:MAG: DUF1648 domain-containing protein [Candidatus Eremiobacteraeota bacterium]|nr:DUF1648 domain-containing protein [Candidatus Eremiobacteraeota bacterium]
MVFAVLFLSALGLAIVALTIAFTASRYPSLPASIPIHFSLNGTIDGHGPRWTAWLLVAVQAMSAATVTPAMLLAFSTHAWRPLTGTLGFTDSILAILLRAQFLILTHANATGRVAMQSFWLFFVAVFAAGIFFAIFFSAYG